MPVKESRNSTCLRFEQVDDLFSIVVELKEGVQRLRSLGECKQEIDLWSNSPQTCKKDFRVILPKQ